MMNQIFLVINLSVLLYDFYIYKAPGKKLDKNDNRMLKTVLN